MLKLAKEVVKIHMQRIARLYLSRTLERERGCEGGILRQDRLLVEGSSSSIIPKVYRKGGIRQANGRVRIGGSVGVQGKR